MQTTLYPDLPSGVDCSNPMDIAVTIEWIIGILSERLCRSKRVLLFYYSTIISTTISKPLENQIVHLL